MDDLVGLVTRRSSVTPATTLWPLRSHVLRWTTLPVVNRLTDLTGLLGSLREDAQPLRTSEIHAATLPIPIARADAVLHPLSRPDPRDGPTPNGPMGETVLDIRSRDFH